MTVDANGVEVSDRERKCDNMLHLLQHAKAVTTKRMDELNAQPESERVLHPYETYPVRAHRHITYRAEMLYLHKKLAHLDASAKLMRRMVIMNTKGYSEVAAPKHHVAIQVMENAKAMIQLQKRKLNHEYPMATFPKEYAMMARFLEEDYTDLCETINELRRIG